MKRASNLRKHQLIKVYLQLSALLILLPSIIINAQYVKIPDGWSDGYVFANEIITHKPGTTMAILESLKK